MSYELAKKFGPLHKPYTHAISAADGYLESERPGLKHYAVRSSGRDSDFRPSPANVAPRLSGWTPLPPTGTDAGAGAGASGSAGSPN